MKITILTLFPEMFSGPFSESILKRAQDRKLLQVELVNIRDFGIGRHKVVDDTPYGGGIGMVMKVDVLGRAIASVKDPKLSAHEEKTILLDARGTQFVQKTAIAFTKLKHLILVCGHYEGVDERVRSLVDETISLGDYIVTGGEIPAMMITDAVGRLLKGVLKDDATAHESFSITHKESESLLLEYPQYTMPQEYNGMKVPDILLSGNHKEIENWRQEQAIEITKTHRTDLLKK